MSTGHYAIRPAGDEYLGTPRSFSFLPAQRAQRWSPVSAADPPRNVGSQKHANITNTSFVFTQFTSFFQP